MWNRVRRVEEIATDKDVRLSGQELGLVGYWTFPEKPSDDHTTQAATRQVKVLQPKDHTTHAANGKIVGQLAAVDSPLQSVFAAVGDRYIRSLTTVPSDRWSHLAATFNQSYALEFNARDNRGHLPDYLDCGNSVALNIHQDLTIEAVVQLPNLTSQGILSKGQFHAMAQKEGVPYALSIEDGQVVFTFEDNQGELHQLRSPKNKLSENAVHHIAVTRKEVMDTADQGANLDDWGITLPVDTIKKKDDLHDSNNKAAIDDSMKADYVDSKKHGKDLRAKMEAQHKSARDRSQTPKTPGLTNQATAQWIEMNIFIDGALVNSGTIQPTVSLNGNNQPLQIGQSGGHFVHGTICEVRLWDRALDKGELHHNITGREKGLISWWPFEDRKGNIASDRVGGNHGKIHGAQWVKNPDPNASPFNLYLNGTPLVTESSDPNDLAITSHWGEPGFSVGGRQENGLKELWEGALDEVRIWKVARTQEQLLDNLFTHLKGEKRDLLAYYPFDNHNNHTIEDESLQGRHLRWPTQDNMPHSILSTAPISSDAAQVRPALTGVETDFHVRIEGAPAVQEYSDMEYDSEKNFSGVFKRCYAYIEQGQWKLVTGYKVSNLITEWISQAQFDPQVIGFIEGAPPVPSENLTLGPVSSSDSYAGQSTVEFVEADDVTYSFTRSKENGFSSSFEMGYAAGADLDLRMLIAPLGFGVSEKVDVTFGASGSGKFESSGSWTDDHTASVGRHVTRTMKAELQGTWEDPEHILNSRLGAGAFNPSTWVLPWRSPTRLMCLPCVWPTTMLW